jgi:hypothetical protein
VYNLHHIDYTKSLRKLLAGASGNKILEKSSPETLYFQGFQDIDFLFFLVDFAEHLRYS